MNKLIEPKSIWPGNSLANAPLRAYTDAQVYARELERIFYWRRVMEI
jgi:hypothetical protein